MEETTGSNKFTYKIDLNNLHEYLLYIGYIMSSFKRFSKISRWSKKQEFELLKTVALMEGRNILKQGTTSSISWALNKRPAALTRAVELLAQGQKKITKEMLGAKAVKVYTGVFEFSISRRNQKNPSKMYEYVDESKMYDSQYWL